MRIITFKREGGPLTFKVSVSGVVIWRYHYVADGADFVRRSSDGPPPVHALGMPGELHADANSWDVQVVSPDQQPRPFTVEIVWSQDGTTIERWLRSGQALPDAAHVERDDAFLLGGP